MTANSLSIWPSATATVRPGTDSAPCALVVGHRGQVQRPVSVQSDDGQDWVKGIDIPRARRFCIVDTVFCQSEVTADLRVARERP
jgi:hypothetical protein